MNDEQIDILADTHLYVGYDTRHSGAPTAVVEGYREFARALLAASASAEPIYQVRKVGQLKWQDMQAISMSMYAGNDDYQTRTVYAAPRPIEAPDNKK